jgi:hypothetical protein
MFSEIVNYIVIPTLLSASALGAYYVWSPEDSKKLISNVAWYGVNMYSRASIYYETFAQSDLSDNEEDNFDEEESLLYYNSENQLLVSLGTDYKTMPDEWWNDSNNIDLLMFKKSLGDSIKYKTFNTHKELMKSDNDWVTSEKQFVQVELEQNGVVIDIHKHLDHFYTVGNSILSKSFLRWYLKTWYNMELCDEYTLKIFDKDVNLFSIGPESYILLGNEKYSIINTENEEIADTNYEGATDE